MLQCKECSNVQIRVEISPPPLPSEANHCFLSTPVCTISPAKGELGPDYDDDDVDDDDGGDDDHDGDDVGGGDGDGDQHAPARSLW